MHMSPDLANMSLNELLTHRDDVDAAILNKKELEKAQVIEDMKSLAEERGFDFGELVGGKKARKKPQAKYRNPEDASQTWTGMGRKPKWVEAALADGKSLDDLKIWYPAIFYLWKKLCLKW